MLHFPFFGVHVQSCHVVLVEGLDLLCPRDKIRLSLAGSGVRVLCLVVMVGLEPVSAEPHPIGDMRHLGAHPQDHGLPAELLQPLSEFAEAGQLFTPPEWRRDRGKRPGRAPHLHSSRQLPTVDGRAPPRQH